MAYKQGAGPRDATFCCQRKRGPLRASGQGLPAVSWNSGLTFPEFAHRILDGSEPVESSLVSDTDTEVFAHAGSAEPHIVDSGSIRSQ